jgi:hypothetical protein
LSLPGIGEYVKEPPSHVSFKRGVFDSIPSFEITENAVVVNSANPLAIRDAVEALIAEPQTARRIGINARKSLTSYFTVERQLTQYQYLYESIYEALHSPP